MKVLKKLALSLTAAALAAAAFVAPHSSQQNVITASAATTMTAKEITQDMGLGWNLGNTFDASDCSWLSNELDYESAWCGVKTTKALIDKVAALGFTSIRIPISWHNHVDGNNNISTAWMNRVKTVVDYAIADDLYVIINIHHDNDIRSGKTNFFYPSSEYLTTSKNYVSTIWKQIATTFKNYDQHLIFETLNEPRLIGDTNEWWFTKSSPQSKVSDAISCINTLNQTAVTTIRGTGGNNSKRLIMCPGYDASLDGTTVSSFKLPTDSSNMLAVSVHAYSPYDFAMNYAHGTTSYTSAMQSQLKDVFTTLNNSFVKKNIPVVIGEFGATDKNNTSARVSWAKDYMSQATALGIPCLLWDNNAFGTGDEKFGIIDRSSNTVKNTTYLNAYSAYLKTIKGSVKDATVSIKYDSFTYTGSAIKPDSYITVNFKGTTLKNGTDYTITYKNNTKVGVATATITGKGRYNGTNSITFVVKPKVNEVKMLRPYTSNGGIYVYWNKDTTATAYQIYYSKTSDFSSKYSYIISDTSRTYCYLKLPKGGETWYVRVRSMYTVDGDLSSKRYGNFSPVKSIKVETSLNKLSAKSASLTCAYTGSALTPSAIVMNGTTQLAEGTDYTLSYTNNVKVGKAVITIKGKGKYTGTITRPFYIIPKKNAIKSITTTSGAFKLTWTKGTAGTVGYEVVYSTTSNFSSNVKTWVTSDVNHLTENFSSIPKSGETWYVKVRSFYTLDGKISSTRYGTYSAVKSITIK